MRKVSRREKKGLRWQEQVAGCRISDFGLGIADWGAFAGQRDGIFFPFGEMNVKIPSLTNSFVC
jgi:hypothetical protein